MGDLTKNFSASEFACPCCGESKMDPRTMSRLQSVRDTYGKRIDPVEGGGYRCLAYDGRHGAHTLGQAVDPGIPRGDLYEFIGIAMRLGFTGIGVKQKSGRWQLHIDDADGTPTRPRPWVWTY
jgi:uncharacterized protein YcbK (DUF882 family)